MASGKRITQVPDALLLRAGDLPSPGTQASAELVRPLIRCLEDDATAFTAHQDLALSSEPALLWEPDRLTTAVLEELRASSFRGVSPDLCLYMVKLPAPPLARRPDVEVGVLTEDDRVELIEGEIVELTPIGRRHAACVAVLNRALLAAVGDRALLWPQNPVRLPGDTKPQVMYSSRRGPL